MHNNTLEDKSDALWADLLAAALQPVDLSEIAGLFSVVVRASRSQAAADRLGDAHAVVRLAAAVIGSGRRPASPDRAAQVVVVAAYLAEPSLSERWFGYSLDGPGFVSLACRASEAFRSDPATCAGQ